MTRQLATGLERELPCYKCGSALPVEEMTPLPTFRLRPPFGWQKVPYCATCLESVPSAGMSLRSRMLLLPLLIGGLFFMPDVFRDMGLDIPTVPFVVVVTVLILLIMWRAEETRRPEVPYTLGIGLGFDRMGKPLSPLKAALAVVVGVVSLIVFFAVTVALWDLFS